LEKDEELEAEQLVLDEHDEAVAALSARIKAFMSVQATSGDPELRKIVSKRLRRLASVDSEITDMKPHPGDACLIQQRQEQLQELKQELNGASKDLLPLDLDDGDDLMVLQAALETSIFNDSLELKRMSSAMKTTTAADGRGVKLPKIDVPVFSGNILHWRTFWEQFTVAVHSRSDISDPEKLVHLQQSVKNGSAKGMIEGLSRSAKHYTEAVESLKVVPASFTRHMSGKYWMFHPSRMAMIRSYVS
jgi:hypothetical protein